MKKTVFVALIGLFFSVVSYAQNSKSATGIKFTEASWKKIVEKAKAEKNLSLWMPTQLGAGLVKCLKQGFFQIKI
jgi:hypothetical protein